MSDFGQLPNGLALVPVDEIQPCPIQPRVNFSVDLIEQLSTSMRAGRHQPLLEVEPAPGAPGRYQIVCGEQRWRAARAAGVTEVLVRLHRPLGYLERLERQYEENRLRADLDPVEEAHCLLLDHTIRSIAVAEQLLRDALVPFQPLADRLDGDVQEQVRALPAEHAIQISRLGDRERQTELATRAGELTHDEVRGAVERLRRNPDLAVEAAVEPLPPAGNEEGPLSFHQQLGTLADLCRQFLRLFDNIRTRLSPEERREVQAVLADLRHAIAAFVEEAAA